MSEPDDDNWRQWQQALTTQRMHHAWLLAGPEGLGKGTFALAAARTLVAKPEMAPHPDIIELSHLPKDDKEARKRDEGKSFEIRRNISIAQIREMQGKLTTRPSLGERRAIVIDPADDMERSASNALLKSLEEPPRGSFFLLIAHQPARLLPTIRSRCRLLRFRPVSTDVLRTELQRDFADEEPRTIECAASASNGSVGKARRFIELGLGETIELLHRISDNDDSDLDLPAKLANSLGARPDRARLSATLEIAAHIVGQQALHADRRAFDVYTRSHNALRKLEREVATYNYDPQLLAMQIGTLLASLR